MSINKKIGAVVLGMGSAVGWLAVNAAKAAFNAAAGKVGDGSVTSKNGQTYTGSDFRDAAGKCNDDLFTNGFKKAKELWENEDDEDEDEEDEEVDEDETEG